MKYSEIAKRLRDIEEQLIKLRQDVEYDEDWGVAIETIDAPRLKDEWKDWFRAVEEAYVEQVELSIHDTDSSYRVHMRYDDDTLEEIGIFSQYSSAYEYARDQARRYHVSIFDSTYEQLVD